jgi:hypothetical protein
MSLILFRTSRLVPSVMVSIVGFRSMAQDFPEHGCKGTAIIYSLQAFCLRE